jgi:exosortase/archaeosortase family protein
MIELRGRHLLTLDKKTTFIIVVVSLFSLLSLHLALIYSGIYTPISHTLDNADYVSGILYEFLPLAFMISILLYLKLDTYEIENDKHFDKFGFGVIISVIVLFVIILFRVIDSTLMITFAGSTYFYGLNRKFTAISFHILFYSALSIILLTVVGLFFNKKGLKTLLPIYIIPIFYSLNADLILKSNVYAPFSVFYPVYQFILEFGRIETLFIDSFLKLFSFNVTVFVKTFPYRLFLGSTIYSIDLPCIGWEGIMGYTIIFLNFLTDLVKSNKMRLFWGVLGLIGTIFVNIFRLTLIFIAGELWNVEAAVLIHRHGGDIIFIAWIFFFIFIIAKIKNINSTRVFVRLKSILNLQ